MGNENFGSDSGLSEIPRKDFCNEQQMNRLSRLHQQTLWKVWGVVAFSALVLVGGSVWLALQYRQDIKRNQISADLLRAYNQADVNLCDGRLCARVEAANGGAGRYGEYVLVKPRSSREDASGPKK